MRKQIVFLLLLIGLQTANPTRAGAQWVPAGGVLDAPLGVQSTVIVSVELLWQFLNQEGKPFQETIKNVHDFFLKTNALVNGAVRDMRMAREIVAIQGQIMELFSKTVSKIHTLEDADGDGQTDLDVLDRWRHIQILTAISGEAVSALEIFTNVVEDDALAMNDKARISWIHRVYREMRKIRRMMYVQIRRINLDMYKATRVNQEARLWKKLFSPAG